jgi:glutathione peroxidase
MKNFYDFEAEDIKGSLIQMSAYRGNFVLVANTASHCAFTPQYAGLEKLYEDYKDKGFVILAFPCNQFGQQEPGSNEEIFSFCRSDYGVTFPIFAKIKVNGPETHPLFKYLKDALPDAVNGSIKWNFTKFLIDRDGQPIKRFRPDETPAEIEKYLSQLI